MDRWDTRVVHGNPSMSTLARALAFRALGGDFQRTTSRNNLKLIRRRNQHQRPPVASRDVDLVPRVPPVVDQRYPEHGPFRPYWNRIRIVGHGEQTDARPAL
jgi:hypothetical protein